MKRLIKNDDQLDLSIRITFVSDNTGQDIAATTIRPVGINKDTGEIDEEARVGFSAFVQNVFEIIDAYGFTIFDEFQHTSKSYPYTSEYRWLARQEEVKKGEIPLLIKLRISDHQQQFSKDRVKELTRQNKEQADTLKLPKTKKTQRYVVKEIVVTGLGCRTYEHALYLVEDKIRNWLISRHIDISEYGSAIWQPCE